MKRLVCLILLGSIAMGLAEVKLKEDAPVVSSPKSGRLSGTLAGAEKINSVQALSRTTGKTYAPAAWDKKTGKFQFNNLPGDAFYDLRVTCADGRVIEGIDLSYVDARLQKLADLQKKQLGLPVAKSKPMTKKDIAALSDFVKKWDDFLDIRRVLYIADHGGKATMLVELMRARDFHDDKGELVWRVELWYMRNAGGGWERLPNQDRTLRRIRTTPEAFGKISVEYLPAFSLYIDNDGRSAPAALNIPAKPAPNVSRLPGQPYKLPGNPKFIPFPPTPTSQPASAPASQPAQ